MTSLKQVCNSKAQYLREGSRLEGRSGKLARLEETLEEVLAAGEKALLFKQYAEFGGMLREHLAATFGREVAYLHGGVHKAERDALVERFQGPPWPPLFVLSLKAGGTGLTLTAAPRGARGPLVEPGGGGQATDWAYRIGQTWQVQARKLVCAGTLEEKIAQEVRDRPDVMCRDRPRGPRVVVGTRVYPAAHVRCSPHSPKPIALSSRDATWAGGNRFAAVRRP